MNARESFKSYHTPKPPPPSPSSPTPLPFASQSPSAVPNLQELSAGINADIPCPIQSPLSSHCPHQHRHHHHLNRIQLFDIAINPIRIAFSIAVPSISIAVSPSRYSPYQEYLGMRNINDWLIQLWILSNGPECQHPICGEMKHDEDQGCFRFQHRRQKLHRTQRFLSDFTANHTFPMNESTAGDDGRGIFCTAASSTR